MVAVVGMSLRFPGAETPEALWELLENGVDAIESLPPSRADMFPRADQPFPRWGGFLRDVDCFDNGFFHINGLEAKYTDPQQRLLLQGTWEALEDGGFRPSQLAGSTTGVFVGAHTQDYLEWCIRSGAEINAYWNAGLNSSILANRISYCFDFTGPSLTLNTACSSGLEAVHWAVRALREGQCDLALAAGVNLILTPTVTISAARSGMLSPEGRCKSFDQDANGFVRGEGVGVLVLKRLSRALADNDRIYAVINGSAVRHGGHANSLTTPNLNQQREVLTAAYRDAGIDPNTVTYLEAHGTGTKLGDAVEVEALKEAFRGLADRPGAEPRTFSCGLGSIKSNIGHLEAAAGIAGLIKVCLAMRHERLPATIHFRRLSPMIDLRGAPFHIVEKNQPWPRAGNTPRRAGVSSFGFGGAYAHVVLEEPPPPPPRINHTTPNGPELVVCSAKDATRLKAAVARLRHFLTSASLGPESFSDLAFTLRTGREPMAARFAAIADSPGDLIETITCFEQDRGGENRDYFPSERGQASGEEDGHEGLSRLHGRALLETMAHMWTAGQDVDWRLLPDRGCRRTRAPTYPFAKKRHWIHSE